MPMVPNALALDACGAPLKTSAFQVICKLRKTGSDDRRFELCFQQSTGNSTGPKVNLLLGPLRHFPVDQDVSDLKPPT